MSKKKGLAAALAIHERNKRLIEAGVTFRSRKSSGYRLKSSKRKGRTQ